MNVEQTDARILIVDDRVDKAEALASLVSDLGQVVMAHSGKDALRCLLNTEFAVIMLDVNMPGMDGFETAALIRQSPSLERTPIIFITAYNNNDTHITRGYSLGAVDYIFAPPIPEILRAKINVFVDLYKKTVEVRHRGKEREQLVREQTARFAAEENEHRAAFLAESSRLLSSSLEPHQVLGKILQLIVPKYSSSCCVDLHADNGQIYRAAKASLKRELPLFSYQDPKFCNQLQILPDLESIDGEKYGLSPEEVQTLREAGVKSLIMAPLVSPHRHYGHLVLARTADEPVYQSAERLLAEDLAQRIALSLEQAHLYREAQEANRLKDEFLAVVSHELRTPLTPILGWIRILNSPNPDAATTARGLEVIERNVKAQVKLIDDLLDVSRIVTGKLRLNVQKIDVIQVVGNAIESMKLPAQAKHIELQTEIAPDLREMYADPERLAQILWNLVHNAIKFTPQGGRVLVEAERYNGQVRFRVRDNGKGIPTQFLPFVFDRFRQADGSSTRKEGGLGLGLAIVRHLSELHGGQVQVVSPGEGAGAIFTVTLPNKALLDSASMSSVGNKAVIEVAPLDLSSVRILVVDDERDTREMVGQSLKITGAQVKVVASASEALEILKVQPFDLLISDLSMPDMDGYELIQSVRNELNSQIPAIALSAACRPEDSNRALATGFHQHISKPIEPEALVRAINLILAHASEKLLTT